ncbi:MAG: hypothetical protein HZB63_07135, partial [Deltaproteobacteria bacterium]|nr:hypothetical protein [Deltaproteobacteria bacterium]
IEILVALANRLGADWKFDGDASVFNALAAASAPFSGMSYESLGFEGQLVAGGLK